MKDQETITPADQYVIDFVRALRIEKGLTQQDIGNILGSARQYIGDVESPNRRAKYNIRHINILAHHFGISPRMFLPEKAVALLFSGREKEVETKRKKAVTSNKKGVKSKAVTKKNRSK